MTLSHTEKLEAVRRAVVKANPDIEIRMGEFAHERPIRLADVLTLWKEKHGSRWVEELPVEFLTLWNLRDDNLFLQTPEAILFLYDLGLHD